MARKRYDDNGAELVTGSAAEQLHDEQKAKAIQLANTPAQTGVNTYWGGTTSDQTRAADDLAREKEVKRIDELHKTRDATALARENTDRLIAADDKRTAREEAKLDTQMKIAELRWGPDGALGGAGTGGGGGSRGGGMSTEKMAHEAALKIMDRTTLPGQQPVSYQKAMAEARQAFVTPPPPPGTAATAASATQAPALPENQLSEDRWKQYGDKKGLTYQGLQPGIQNDQIARFTRPDGVAHFVNVGAANNALAGIPRPSTNTQQASTSQRDQDVRSTPYVAPVKAPVKQEVPYAERTPIVNSAIKNLSTWLGNRPENPQNFADDDESTQMVPQVPIAQRDQTLRSTPYTEPKGVRDWLASWNKKKKSTHPLFPNYEQ